MASKTMRGRIGIRKEDKDETEKRAPLTPEHVKSIVENHGVQVLVQPAGNRIFSEQAYAAVGALLSDDLSSCNVVFGVKEIPLAALAPRKTYCFFSHTIKGQAYNMPMLEKILELDCTLIDYEKVTDQNHRRLIMFGEFAGYAGMIDSLWSLGQRLLWEGITTPFATLKQANRYPSLDAAKQAVAHVGQQIHSEGLPAELCPLVCGFTGSGHVSRGAQEIYDLLQPQVVEPPALAELATQQSNVTHIVYKTAFQREHRVRPSAAGAPFSKTEFANNPGTYENNFEQFLPYLTVLINGVYWEPGQPVLVSEAGVLALFEREQQPRLRVIGDISNDIRGSIACNFRATNSGNPVYVYDPFSRQTIDGFTGAGVVLLAVDKLPSELPREASAYFGDALLPFVPALAHANFSLSTKHIHLLPAFARAVIAHQGELTADFRYLTEFLKTHQ